MVTVTPTGRVATTTRRAAATIAVQ
jgi:hypothetical protein